MQHDSHSEGIMQRWTRLEIEDVGVCGGEEVEEVVEEGPEVFVQGCWVVRVWGRVMGGWWGGLEVMRQDTGEYRGGGEDLMGYVEGDERRFAGEDGVGEYLLGGFGV